MKALVQSAFFFYSFVFIMSLKWPLEFYFVSLSGKNEDFNNLRHSCNNKSLLGTVVYWI